MPIININNAKIYYELHGKGYPLVLIAGFGCDHSFWQPFIKIFSKQFQLLIFDNRGSGQTQDNTLFTIETLADDTIALAKALNLCKPHIIGHSMGGAIAQQIAIKYPNELSKLIICNSTAKFSALSLMAIKSVIDLQQSNIPFEILLDCFITWVFSNEFLSDANNVKMYKDAAMNYPFPQSLEGNSRQLKALEQFDVKNLIENIVAETFIIGSDRDLLVAPNEIGFLNKHIKNSKFVILPGAHNNFIDRFDVYVPFLSEFL